MTIRNALNRLQASQQLRREGYRKHGERITDDGRKLLVYVQRRYVAAGKVPIREAYIYPDGSIVRVERN